MDAFRLLRRNMAQAVMNLANKHQGGTWSLVNVHELDDVTHLDFEIDYPIRDYRVPQVVKRMRVTLAPLLEEDPEPEATP